MMKKLLPLLILSLSLAFVSGNTMAADKWSQKFAEKYSYNNSYTNSLDVGNYTYGNSNNGYGNGSTQKVFWAWTYSWRYGWQKKNLFWWKKKKLCRWIWWCKPVSRS